VRGKEEFHRMYSSTHPDVIYELPIQNHISLRYPKLLYMLPLLIQYFRVLYRDVRLCYHGCNLLLRVNFLL
jgi:hypothetical protein